MIKTFIAMVSCRVLVIVWLAALCLGGHGPLAVKVASSAPATASMAIWRGGTDDPRWSNPANWEAGHVPSAIDTVRLPAGTGDSVVDADFGGNVAAISLEEGYAGTLSLARALNVRGALDVRGGMVAGDADVLNAETLSIGKHAIVRLGANGKLNLSGDGGPLSGDGQLDTTTNTPNSVEYTGHATGDLTAAGPAAAFHGLSSNATQVRRSDSTMTDDFVHNAPSLTETSHITLQVGEDNLADAVIDAASVFAYFGANGCHTLGCTSPGIIVKLRLSDFTRVGALTLNAGEYGLAAAIIDTTGGFAYFGGWTNPGIIVKVRLSDFTRVGALTLSTGDQWLTSAVIDPANGYAYFGTYGGPGIVKVRLSDFTRVGALSLDSGERFLTSAVIDPANGYAYFGTDTSSGVVVKVRLSDFTRVNALTLNTGEGDLRSAVIDTENGFAYFGALVYPSASVVKLRLSDFTRVGVLDLQSGYGMPSSAVIDTVNLFAYFGTYHDVVKVRLSNFTRVGAVALNSQQGVPVSAVIDLANGYAYFGTESSPGTVIKIDINSLKLTASSHPFAASSGEVLTYTLAITNAMQDTATGLTLTDTLPVSVTFVSASIGCSQTDGQVTCNLGGLPAGASTRAFILVRVTSTVMQYITNTAVVNDSDLSDGTPVEVSVTTLLNPPRRYLPLVGR